MLRCAFLCCAVLCEGSLFATGGQLLGLQVLKPVPCTSTACCTKSRPSPASFGGTGPRDGRAGWLTEMTLVSLKNPSSWTTRH